MKFFTKKSITQKIIIVAIISILFGFVFPTYSHAGVGGLLLDPLVELVGTLFDSIISGLQYFLMDGDFGASGTKGLLNTALVNAGDFNASKYPDFTYNPNSKAEIVEISKDDLTLNLFGAEGYFVPVFQYTPQKIFSNQVPALDANFVNPTEWKTEAEQQRSIALQVHDTISSWYVSLRNLTIIGLMSVLLYIGIRIVISSAASEKSKYKQMLVDWLVAMCLVFTLHYIMAFTTTIVNQITEGIIGATKENKGNNIPVTVSAGTTITEIGSDGSMGNTSYNDTTYLVKADGTVWEWFDPPVAAGVPYTGPYYREVTDEKLVQEILEKHEADKQNNTSTSTTTTTDPGTVQFNTDLMGLIRFKMQSSDVWTKLLYLVFYMAMVIYTCMFTFVYLKRVLIIGFLTLISPLVALTYPIDKIKDGKAQAFNKWLKEYVFNILIQPFHLIIYTVFVSSAIDLSAKNPIFAIVALAFIMPAEKILRSLFGFEEAKTGGALSSIAGIAGGTAAFNMVSRALGKGGKGKNEKGGNSQEKNIRTSKGVTADAPKLGEASFGGSEGSEESEDSERFRQMEDDVANMREQEAIWRQAGPEAYTPPQEPSLWQRAWQTDENDTRGLGQYLRDGAGTLLSGTSLGQSAKEMRENANMLKEGMKEQAREFGNKHPILRNTAKGTLGAAKYLGKKGIRTAGRVASAVPGAMFGMAAGITGDSLGDIAKYTAAGAALSTAAMPQIGNSIKSGSSNVAHAYREGAYGEKQAALLERKEDFIKSTDLDEEIRGKFKSEDGGELSNSQVKEIKEQASYFDGLGIEGKDSIRAVELQRQLSEEIARTNPELSENEANKRGQLQSAVIMKKVEEYSAKDLRDKDTVAALRDDLAAECKSAGLDNTETKNTVNMIVGKMKKIRKVNNNY